MWTTSNDNDIDHKKQAIVMCKGGLRMVFITAVSKKEQDNARPSDAGTLVLGVRSDVAAIAEGQYGVVRIDAQGRMRTRNEPPEYLTMRFGELGNAVAALTTAAVVDTCVMVNTSKSRRWVRLYDKASALGDADVPVLDIHLEAFATQALSNINLPLARGLCIVASDTNSNKNASNTSDVRCTIVYHN